MINTFAQIDYLASAGRSPWHRASALGKLILTLLIVAVAVFAPSPAVLVVALVTSLALGLTAQLPPRLIAAAASTPLLFSIIFAIAGWKGDWSAPLVLVLRPMIASLTAVWLVGTTPYPDLFAPLSHVLPRNVGDGLFLTYRAVFVLLARVELMWRALTLRGGLGRPTRARMTILGEAVGTVVLSGFDRSQRLYQTMHLRGHSGRICGCRHYLEFTRDDFWVAVTATWMLFVSVLWWRMGTGA